MATELELTATDELELTAADELDTGSDELLLEFESEDELLTATDDEELVEEMGSTVFTVTLCAEMASSKPEPLSQVRV